MKKVFNEANSISFPTSALTIRHEDSFEDLSKGFKVRHASGIVVGEFGVLDCSLGDQIVDSITAWEMSKSVGEWVGVAEMNRSEGNRYLVFADSYGYASLFYSLIPGQRLIISDSFNGVAGELSARGYSCRLNIDNYVATVASWRSQFASPRPNVTMANEIGLLPMDKALLVDSSGVIEIPRSSIGGLGMELGYEDLLIQGNKFIENVITEVGNLSDVPKGLLLSGGVDSRLVFSLMLKAGMKDVFELRTSDPRDYSNPYTRRVYERDVQIANEIRECYAMKWMEKGDSHVIPISFRESLLAHQSHHSNFAYNFNPSSRIGLLDKPTITLRGGGGEILRSTSTGWGVEAAVKKERQTEGSTVDRQFSWWYMEHSNWSNIFDERISEYIQDGFRGLTGGSLVEKLNAYYLHTRNRSHFGHARASRSRNEIPLQFLSNVYYLEASRKISFQDKADGQMVADIFSMTTPALLNFPFESADWHARLASSRAKLEVGDKNAWMAEFDRLKENKKNIKTSSVWKPGVRGEISDYDVEAACNSYLKASFQLLEEVTNEEGLESFHQQVWSGLRSGRLKVRQVVSKVASAVDVFFPSVPGGVNLSLETSSTSVVRTFSSVELNTPTIIQDGWNNISTPELQPTLSLKGRKIHIDAQPSTDPGAGATFAFYLYKDGERVETSWYSSGTTVLFDWVIEPGSYHGRVFFKLPHVHKPVLIRETESIVLTSADLNNRPID